MNPVKKYLSEIGRKGRAQNTPAQIAAAKKNGRRGGRPTREKLIAAAKKSGWKNIGPDPTGKLVGLPPHAQSPADYEPLPRLGELR